MGELIDYARNFKGLAKLLSSMFPRLSPTLKWAGIKQSVLDYTSLAILISASFSAFYTTSALITLFFLNILNPYNFLFSLATGFLIFWLAFILKMRQPYFLANKRSKDFDKNIAFAIREIYVRVNSGQTLFNAISRVGFGDYGEISEEFKKYVHKLETGKSELEALEELAGRIASEDFRRLLWQLINSLKEGSDVSKTLRSMVQNIERSKKIRIEQFSSKLTPLSVMYLLSAIILPALGMTLMIILSSLMGNDSLTKIFYLIPVYLVVINTFFLTAIRKVRPHV